MAPAAHAQLPVMPYGGNPYVNGGMMNGYGGMNSYGSMYYYDPVSSVVYLRQSIAQFDRQGEVGIGGLQSNPYGSGYGGYGQKSQRRSNPYASAYQPDSGGGNIYQPYGGKDGKEKSNKLDVTIMSDDPSDALVRGLAKLGDQPLKLYASDVIDARKGMNAKRLQTLIQSVTADKQARDNAEELTRMLQTRGILLAGERVVGVADGKVYATLAPWR